MSRTLTIRAKVLWIAFFVNVVYSTVYTTNSYFRQKQSFLDGIDNKLTATAYALPKLLPDGFHDRVTGPDAISSKEHYEHLMTLSRYADKTALVYIYSYVKRSNEFFVAATSATPEERETGEETGYYQRYEQVPEKMLEAWNTESLRYDEYTDEWGHFRSIFLPMRTPSGARYIIGADVSLAFIKKALQKTLLLGIGLGIVVFVLVWLLSYWIFAKTLAPITGLTAYTNELADRDFQLSEKQRLSLFDIADKRRDEVGKLARSFLDMQSKLLEYIENLRETTAAKERIESELNVAHNIQMSLVPKTFPPFPDREEFDLYAVLEPAKEVGGDLYDFALVGEDNLYFCIGDVSDKGVPAALFMSVTRTFMKVAAQDGLPPDEMLAKVNVELAEDNENMMFVTLCCGIFNFKTGELVYSNAGHNPPVLIRANGTIEWLEMPEGLVLGAMPDTPFSARTIVLEPGDQLLTYTDGVTEAANASQELFTDPRLLETAEPCVGKSPEDTVGAVLLAVKSHVAGAPQSDDITILVLKRNA
jgi:sigma-B regulation protein RsbU (phosphoserine phosphatase)